MDSIDFVVLEGLFKWRQKNRHAALVTVVNTWGSSPRPIGSLMALSEDGTVLGSISGGCLEDDIIRRYRNFPIQQSPEILKYGISADEAHQFGLPCGGTIELAVEFDPEPLSIKKIIDASRNGQLIQRELDLKTGQVRLNVISSPQPLTYTKDKLTSIFGPSYRMLIIGAGQLSEYLATMAIFNGFSVTVCDPRKEYHRSWSVKGVEISTNMPDDVVDELKPDPRTCIVALTHDPKLDDLALLSALHSEAFYVGAIGSRKNNIERKQRMVKYLDQPLDLMEKLRGPVGIFIGSKTPAEIAVSIMAEVIAVKNGINLPCNYDVAHAKNRLEKLATCIS